MTGSTVDCSSPIPISSSLDEHGASRSAVPSTMRVGPGLGRPLVGIYPTAGKLRTWTDRRLRVAGAGFLEGHGGPVAAWVRDSAGVMLDLEAAFRAVHQPTEQDGDRAGSATGCASTRRLRLQLTMAYRRADAASHRAVPRQARSGGLLQEFDDRLPFVLTKGQIAVSEEIMAELGHTRPMQRLLQGEVGSGKTLVALRAMLAVVDAGGQAALLAPTEVLASQHYQTITRMLGDLAAGGTLGCAGACHRGRADHRVHVGVTAP